MLKRYIFLIVILLAVIFALLLMPKVYYCANDSKARIHKKEYQCKNISPKALLLEAITRHRYISPDKLTEKVIGEDPSYVYVDLRDANQYKAFSLPNAVNIPAEKLMNPDTDKFFNSEVYNYVLFANGTLVADQVWSVLRKKGHKNILVLEGGLNAFYTKILNPQKPDETDAGVQKELYHFRKAAGTYFGLPLSDEFTPELETKQEVIKIYKSLPKAPKKNIQLKQKPAPKQPVEEEEDEGC